MKITLIPFLTDEKLSLSVSGDVLTVNGFDIDFSVIPEGYRVQGVAIDHWAISGADYVRREAGEIHVVVRLPVCSGTTASLREPREIGTIHVIEGPVELPDTSPIDLSGVSVMEPAATKEQTEYD